MSSPALSINIHYKMPLFLTHHHILAANIIDAKRRNGFLIFKNLITKERMTIK
jgi:hypothetical protein